MTHKTAQQQVELPYEMLSRLGQGKATGEVVAGGDAHEVHIYLCNGRVAWATSSRTPNALLGHLIDKCGLQREVLIEVVARCRRTRQSLGDTLVRSGIATTDQVRDALRTQIAEAIGLLASIPSAEALFLPRDIAYSSLLTFDLGEVCEVPGWVTKKTDHRHSVVSPNSGDDESSPKVV